MKRILNVITSLIATIYLTTLLQIIWSSADYIKNEYITSSTIISTQYIYTINCMYNKFIRVNHKVTKNEHSKGVICIMQIYAVKRTTVYKIRPKLYK